MKSILETNPVRTARPIRVLQFGEGNFLRAFVDYMIDIANERGAFDGNIAIAKPIPFGTLERFQNQEHFYTVVLRGRENGQVVNDSRIITSVERSFDCTGDFDELLRTARLDTLRFVVSNTTEAGITLDPDDRPDGPPRTYPGKLTAVLYERYKAFHGDPDKGLIILPVELIDNNGRELKRCVLALCDCWQLPEDFKNWLQTACVFCSTLVDRIVTGYPAGEADAICEQLGYRDELLDVGEPFALWVIESDRDIRGELPLDRIGLPVIFTDDQTPYHERKVRVLNGAHTASVLAGYLYGLDIVRDCMHDELMGRFIRRVVNEEIVPLVPLPTDDVKAFAEAVFERFDNPFINHALLSISLNSVSKWRARVLPSFRDYVRSNNALPRLMTFSFAALLAFYSADDLREDGLHAHRANGDEYVIHDDGEVMRFFAAHSGDAPQELAASAAARTDFWGEDLSAYPGFTDAAADWLAKLRNDPAAALREVLEG